MSFTSITYYSQELFGILNVSVYKFTNCTSVSQWCVLVISLQSWIWLLFGSCTVNTCLTSFLSIISRRARAVVAGPARDAFFGLLSTTVKSKFTSNTSLLFGVADVWVISEISLIRHIDSINCGTIPYSIDLCLGCTIIFGPTWAISSFSTVVTFNFVSGFWSF